MLVWLLLGSWNVRFQSLGARLGQVMEALESAHFDIVTLQDVKAGKAEVSRQELGRIGLGHVYDGVSTAPEGFGGRKIDQGFIATRWPMEARGDK